MEMGFEMQDRARPLWPQLNGTTDHPAAPGQVPPAPPPAPTAHHNLPPIAALTSCRPTTSLALKTLPAAVSAPVFTPPSPKPPPNNASPCPSPSLRDRRDEHIFALPNPPRPLQTTTRAPTPFPDLHAQSSQVFQQSSSPRPPSSDANQLKPHSPAPPTSPIPFSIPSRSAFAAVPRPQPIRHTTLPGPLSFTPISAPAASSSSSGDSGVVVPDAKNNLVNNGSRNDGAETISIVTPVKIAEAPAEPQTVSENPSVPVSQSRVLDSNPSTSTPQISVLPISVDSSKPLQVAIPEEPGPRPSPSPNEGPEGHQHLTSDGMKSYSNKNRRYLATPSCEEPRISPKNTLSDKEDHKPATIDTYHTRPMHFSAQPNTPHSSSQVMPAKPTSYVPRPHEISHHPENTRPYVSQPEVFTHAQNPQERFRQVLPPISQMKPPIRGQMPEPGALNMPHYPFNSVPTPERPPATRPEFKEYHNVSHQFSPRDVPNSAHAERPLAFHVTGSSRQTGPMFQQSYDPNYAKQRYHESVPPQSPSMSRSTAPEFHPSNSRRESSFNERQRPSSSQPYENKPFASNSIGIPTSSGFTVSDFNRSFQQLNDKNHPPVSGHSLPKNYPSQPYHQQTVSSSKYQMAATHQPYPAFTSPGGLTMTPVAQRKPEPPVSLPQHYPRVPYPGARVSVQPPNSSPSHLRPPQPSHYPRAPEMSKQWHPPTSRVSDQYSKSPLPRPTEPIKQVQLPQDLPQLHRAQMSYPPTSQASRERPQNYPAANQAIVSVSSSVSPRVSTHMSQSGYFNPPTSYMHQQPYQNAPHQSYPNRPIHPTVSSSFNHMRPNAPVATSSFSQQHRPSLPVTSTSYQPRLPSSSQPLDHRGAYPNSAASSSQHLQRVQESSRQQMSPQGRHHPYPTAAYPYQQHQNVPTSHGAPPALRPTHSPYAPSRGHSQESDICRNPFELPIPSSTRNMPTSSTSVIKPNYPPPLVGHGAKVSDPKGVYNPRAPYDPYGRPEPKPEESKYGAYPVPSARTQQRSVSGSDDRQKPPQISARFPPVPQSNFDLQRQIYDRMTGLQQAPPRLLEKSAAEEKTAKSYKVEAPPLKKRESPLDLSVKTVRQSADSTRDDVDPYTPESRLASAPKIDFNPNFSSPFVQPEAVPLPPAHSIRKFAAPNQPVVGYMQESPYVRKRPADDREMAVPQKIQKVDRWKQAMDEQIEERLKSARQARPPAAPLTPLHPPAQSVTPTNPEGLQPPARPHHDPYALAHRDLRVAEQAKARAWSTFQPPVSRPDSERIIQQISQGVLPDSRLLEDHTVVDKIRSSLAEKEARLQALQASARIKQPLPSFNAFGAEIMRTPPSYHQPPPRGAEPVPIGIEPNKKYARTPIVPGHDPDLDGLAAFLAARIRTKAEMKQIPSDAFKPPEFQMGRQLAPGVSPPRSIRDGRLSQSSQGSRRQLMSPGSEDSGGARQRDPGGIRSSSETSVFDFRESDSEGEATGTERTTLEGMRRPRKSLPKTDVKPEVPPMPPLLDPEWGNAVEMFVKQLATAPIKRSVRKKKPNPKFFAKELESPKILKPKDEDPVIKSEMMETIPKREIKVERLEEGEILPLPEVDKDESSSDDDTKFKGVTVVKEGRVKLIKKKQRTEASDSEWGSSVEESSNSTDSETSSESSSEEESEDSTVRKARKKALSSSSEDEGGKKRPRTRNRAVSDSESDSSAAKRKKNRKGSESDDSAVKSRRTRSRRLSDSEDEDKPKGRRTRSRVASESEEESSDDKKTKKVGRIQTRQQARAAPPARMKLRSKKRGAAKGTDEDIIKFKKKNRVPDKLINKSKKSPKNEKKVKTEKKTDNKKKMESDSSEESDGARGKKDMMRKRSLRGSVGMRRSNKAVQNSKRHLNKSNKRKKFRSGLDYIRKGKKKAAPRKEGTQTPTLTEVKRKERSEATDISTEVKSWVVNKSAGETLLHRAARLGYADVVAYCLESLRMPPSQKDNAGYTPLHEACTRGHLAVAEYLLQYGASVSESAPGGVRPLHQAVENNHMELVRLLLGYGADPVLATYTGSTAISLATQDEIRDLMQRHVDDVIGEVAPKWQFDGPASIFDPKWFTDSLSEPPSPAASSFCIEMEASRAVLPPLYRLAATEGELFDPSERWVLLSDVVTYANQTSEEVLKQLANTIRRDMAAEVFKERAISCTVLTEVQMPARKVTLLRYDDAVRKLLDVEVTSFSVIER